MSGGLVRYVERHPWWSLVFLLAGGSVAAQIIRAARGPRGLPEAVDDATDDARQTDTSRIA